MVMLILAVSDTMGYSKFVHNANFVGQKVVDGPLNDFCLSDLVDAFQSDLKAKVRNAVSIFWYYRAEEIYSSNQFDHTV